MGLHLIPNDLNINFVGFRKVAYLISGLLLLAGILTLLVMGGLKYGIDFAGGTVVQIKFEQPISDEDLKKALADSELPGLVIQSFGEDSTGYLLRISTQEDSAGSAVREAVTSAMQNNLPGQVYEIQRLEMVGPKVGEDLRSSALQALFLATLLMSVYISGRFEHRWFTALIMALALGGSLYVLDIVGLAKSWQVLAAVIVTVALCWRLKLAFALGAMISILHDLLITVGLFAMMGKEFDLTTIAALLTVVGYSLNDTIIVFDRIRENLYRSKDALGSIINRSVNQTLSRTVLTSGTTMFVILALLFLGGDMIFDFALVLCIGVLVGTLSSIFVASPILLFFEETIRARRDKEEEEEQQQKRLSGKRGVPQV
ncbi:MAG: protein translocase subunit SecF [Deltaproteobacteria bacterium]|nr:protein translocase subunit SecF [Deltaproteobacteria bacterium]